MIDAIERVREVCAKALAVKVAGSGEGEAAMAAMASVILRILDGAEPNVRESDG
ncbi:hypothetical protein [Microbacterium enclense]|uniref:Uncharacterized protein n=1 Tax=Microbacterium enclense TaxID=993073 RepID=A0A1G6NSR0_9MICO|nr:hypothetical protein [Microbacterium enclense]SDC70839.1 hypothetical protein SAMN05216418_2838 [Microbacterium enclense]